MTVRRRVTLTRPELKALRAAAGHVQAAKPFENRVSAQLGFTPEHLTRATAKLDEALAQISGVST